MEYRPGKQKFSPKRLRKMRERAKMSQMVLAFELQTSQDAVSRWERGAYAPNARSLTALCTALKCEDADLFE